jgi:hypothetical protein
MPGMKKDMVKKMKMKQMRNGKETMKKMRDGKKTMVKKSGGLKTGVGKKKLEMRGMAPGGKIENFQDYVSRMFGGGPTK